MTGRTIVRSIIWLGGIASRSGGRIFATKPCRRRFSCWVPLGFEVPLNRGFEQLRDVVGGPVVQTWMKPPRIAGGSLTRLRRHNLGPHGNEAALSQTRRYLHSRRR